MLSMHELWSEASGSSLGPQHVHPPPPVATCVPQVELPFPTGPDFVKGCLLKDCDTTSWLTGKVKAVAKGLSKSKNSSALVRPVISKHEERLDSR